MPDFCNFILLLYEKFMKIVFIFFLIIKNKLQISIESRKKYEKKSFQNFQKKEILHFMPVEESTISRLT